VKRYQDLNEYLFANRKTVSKTDLANRLKIWPSKLTTLLNPESYRVALSEELIERVAEVLGQSVDYVRKFYKKAA
jgi:plasmid maintenance system antidote protein VapI